MHKGARISVSDIINSVGWSSERVFQQYYNKPLEDEFNSRRTILESLHMDFIAE